MSHTPTPWRVERPDNERVVIRGSNDYPIEVALGSREVSDWEHIVRCVNSHDALVEAAKAAESMLEWFGRLPKGYSRAMLRAAIALAEGEKP